MKIKIAVGFLCCFALLLFGCGNPVITYSITYDSNGSTSGTVPLDANLYANGQTATVLGNTGGLVKSTYKFSGWNTEPDGSGTRKLSGAALRMGSSNVILYAQWTTQTTYSVIYDGNGQTGGSAPEDSNDYLSGAAVTVLGNTGTLVRTGYVFAGWNTRVDGTGSTRVAGTSFAILPENVVLYAQWRPYMVGDVGPAGGLVFYDKGSYSDGWRYLEAAPSDQSMGADGGRSEGGVTGSAIGLGKVNTYYLLSLRIVPEGASLCSRLASGGFDDWFLPSLDELNLMFRNLHLNGLGNFGLYWYWSSTEPNISPLYAINFKSGEQASYQGITCHVRAVRSF